METGELMAVINDGHLQVMRVAATGALAGLEGDPARRLQ
jgi:hypothetical protein